VHKVLYDVLQKMQRKTVNLNEREAEAILPYLKSKSTERKLLEELARRELDSDSEVLRALVRFGIRYLRDEQLERGYAEIAANWDEEDEAWAQASMQWAAERWSHEDDE
jgi:hypothetical protein